MQTRKLFLLKHSYEILLQSSFDRMTSHSQSACLYRRALSQLSSNDIEYLHHDSQWFFFLSICSFLYIHETLHARYLFHDTLKKLALVHPPFLFLATHKQMPFHTHTFAGPADLIDILHNNHHSAEALLSYLDICGKCLLVNIAQASCFSEGLAQHVCHGYTWDTTARFIHQFYQDDNARPSF